MKPIRIFLFITLVIFVSACGGGGGGSFDSTNSGTTSTGGGSATGSMDAAGRAIVANLTQSSTSQATSISATVGGAVATGTIARINLVPIISGGTLTGVQMDYVDERTLGSFSGYSSLDGRVVGTGDFSGSGDAQSDGLTRTFVGYTNESARWTFNGVLDVNLRGSLYGGASPFLTGSITDTLNSAGLSATDNDNPGDVYIFDDLKIQVSLTGTAAGQNVSCVAGGVSFVIMHKEGGSTMACDLNTDCTCM